jgi:hypothetical protein
VTSAWLGLGACLIVALVALGAMLPRPQMEYSPLDLARLGSKKLPASKRALAQGDPGVKDGRQGAKKPDPKGDDPADKDKGDKGNGGKEKAKDAKNGDADDPPKKADKGGQEEREAASKDVDSPPQLQWLAKLATVIKWVVFGLLALATVIIILRGGLRYLANFADWARRLLAALRRIWEAFFGGRQAEAASVAVEPARAPPAPFRSFANPFHNGRAEGMSPEDLVRYSFEALEAWAGEHDLGRGTGETPIEFANRIVQEAASLDKETRQTGALYSRVLYAPGDLPAAWRDVLEDFWKRLEEAPRRHRS